MMAPCEVRKDNARYWVGVWFAVRHTGGHGHSAAQARAHARYWIANAR